METEGPELSQPKRVAFLTAYALMGVVTRAAEAADLNPRTHYRWLKEEGPDAEEYREAFAEAHRQACDVLESEARRRAVNGVQRLKFYQGAPIMVPVLNEDGTAKTVDGEIVLMPYVEHEYSDTLLIFALKGSLPEKYRERSSTEITGKGGGPITFKAEDLTDDELAAVVKGQNGEASNP